MIIKYLLISIIIYFVATKFLRPVSNVEKSQNSNDKQQKTYRNQTHDDYIDYEEVN